MPRRKDPKQRQKRPNGGRFALFNKDKDRWYVWANEANEEFGPDYYKAIGYDVEVLKERGVKPAIGKTGEFGQPIRNSGHVLVSCTMERHKEIQEYGPWGDTGQALADEITERMFRPDGPNVDRFRGMKRSMNVGGERFPVRQSRESLA